jgi:hypothetical protein
VALPPLRPAAFFWAVVPPRDELDRELPEVERALEVLDAERDRDVPDVDRDGEVPAVERFLAVLDVDRALLVPEVDRPLLVPDVDRDREVPAVERFLVVLDVDRALLALEVGRLAAVGRPPFAPAAFFCAVLPPRLDVDRDDAREPEVERDRDVVEREEPEVERDFAAVVRPPLAPAALFFAVLPLRVEVDRLEAVLDFARLDDARGEAARTREIETSSSVVPSTGVSYGVSDSK